MTERLDPNTGEEKVKANEVWLALSSGFSELRRRSPFIDALLTKIGERVEAFRFEGVVGDEEILYDHSTEWLFLPRDAQGELKEAIFVYFSEGSQEIAWILFDPANLTYTYASLYDFGSPEHPGPILELEQYFLASLPSSRDIKDLIGKGEGDLFDTSLETDDSKDLTVFSSGEVEYSERADGWDKEEGITLEDALAKFTPNEITRGGLQAVTPEGSTNF